MHKPYWLPWVPLPYLFIYICIFCVWQNDNKTIKQFSLIEGKKT